MDEKNRMSLVLAFFLCLLVVTYQLPPLQLGVSCASDQFSGSMIDLYTQREPYGGKGPNQPSDAFAPQEEVVLYANVTYKGEPEQAKIVAFEIHGPINPLENFTLIRTAMTNASGVATISFGIPWPCENAETIIFGIWTTVAWVEILEETVKDTLTFKVALIVEIVSIWTINENLQPQTRFAKGTCVGVEMILRNIAMTPKKATFTLVVYDCESVPIANTKLGDVEVKPGETSIHILCKLQIPKWAYSGYAMVYANAYTALGGVAYCPEASVGFLITLCDVAVIDVRRSLAEVCAGEVVDITVTVRNEGRETETFNVTAYADKNVTVIGNEIIIGTKSVTNLAPGNQKTLTFTWNTTGVTPGNYTISAQASIVPAEIDIADNTYIDGTVKIVKRPVAYFTYSPKIPIVNETVTFNATLSTPDGGTFVNYEWDFDDGTVYTVDEPVATHNYTAIGTYTVTLTVTDDEGLSGSTRQIVTVREYPVAIFTYSPESPIVGETVTFNASLSTADGGTIVSYVWDFGDDTPVANETDPITTHRYTMVGTYNVTLTVTEDDGLNDTATDALTVYLRDVAVISVAPSLTEVYVGEAVNITVVAKNKGTAKETFNITVYYDENILGIKSVTGSAPDKSTTLTFSWDTSGVPEGEYVIKAVASTVLGETEIVNNEYVNGTIIVKLPPVYVFPRERIILALIVIAAVVVTCFAILLYRRKRKKTHPFSVRQSMSQPHDGFRYLEFSSSLSNFIKRFLTNLNVAGGVMSEETFLDLFVRTEIEMKLNIDLIKVYDALRMLGVVEKVSNTGKAVWILTLKGLQFAELSIDRCCYFA